MENRAWLHKPSAWTLALAMFCLLFAGWTPKARADDAPPRAARLSFLQGTVTVNRVDNTGSDPGQINMPLTQGARVATGQDGQAEIEFEDGSLVRLTPNSSLDLTALTSDANGNVQTSLTLGFGLAYAELRAAEKLTYSLSAGAVQVSPVENTTVRIAMDQPPAVISVLDGTAQVNGGSSAGGEGYRTNVNAGETLTGDASDPGRYSLTQQVADNSWDKWNTDRDAAAATETASQTDVRDQYAGEAGYGWSDLDANGSWYNVPSQGEVWQPNVAMDASFDPYGYGSWVWYPGSGYVWASGYSWGWTPYRCGNWSYWDDFGWGWQPGIGCGGFGGWGFGGGGYAFNIVRPPRNYRFHPLPVRGPGGPHPVRVGHPVTPPVQIGQARGPRTIAGQIVEPLHPVPATAAFRGTRSVGGAALQRDFPVNRASRPAPGNGTTPAGGTPAMGVRPGVMRPVNPRTGIEGGGVQQRSMQPAPPAEQRQIRPQQQQARPSPHYAPPPQHYSPPPQPHYSSPPPASHSSPPAASHK
jgi:FecR protein